MVRAHLFGVLWLQMTFAFVFWGVSKVSVFFELRFGLGSAPSLGRFVFRSSPGFSVQPTLDLLAHNLIVSQHHVHKIRWEARRIQGTRRTQTTPRTPKLLRALKGLIRPSWALEGPNGFIRPLKAF